MPVHTHRWPSLYQVVSGGQFVRRDAAGGVLLDTCLLAQPFELPPFAWSDPLPAHSLENVDTTEIHLLAVEMKDA